MESFPFDVLGNPKMKSIDISTQGIEGIGREVYKPWGCILEQQTVVFLNHVRKSGVEAMKVCEQDPPKSGVDLEGA